MNDALFLSKSLVTRMSHDLAGAVGAVSNGLELLSEEGQADPETLDLIKNSASVLFSRTIFFRAVYGSDGPLTGADAAERILKGYLASLENKTVRFSCLWKVDEGLPLFSFRLILLASQIVAEKMIKGGRITVTATAGTGEISVVGEGERLLPVKEEDFFFNGGECAPKDVAVAFLAEYLREPNWKAEVGIGEGRFGLSLSSIEA